MHHAGMPTGVRQTGLLLSRQGIHVCAQPQTLGAIAFA
jgi:hypothetical protein